MAALNGSVIQCKSRGGLEITVGDVLRTVDAIIVDRIVRGVDIVLGLDAITQLGGVTIDKDMIKFGHVQYAALACAEAENATEASELADSYITLIIQDIDFVARFDGEYWTAEWFCKNQKQPKLKKVDCRTEG